MIPRKLPLVFALVLAATLSAPTYAGHHHNHDDGGDVSDSVSDNVSGNRGRDPDVRARNDEESQGAPRVSLDEAVSRVQSAYRGQVIAASATSSGGHPGYRIRVLQDGGRVRTVFVDAASGAMRESG